jgi:hypothetical protein
VPQQGRGDQGGNARTSLRRVGAIFGLLGGEEGDAFADHGFVGFLIGSRQPSERRNAAERTQGDERTVKRAAMHVLLLNTCRNAHALAEC